MAKSIRDINGEGGEFAVTNWVSRLAFDCNTATLGETSDTLGTLIKILVEQGIISGTVSA